MDEQLRHYERKLAFETDSWDLKVTLDSGENVDIGSDLMPLIC